MGCSLRLNHLCRGPHGRLEETVSLACGKGSIVVLEARESLWKVGAVAPKGLVKDPSFCSHISVSPSMVAPHLSCPTLVRSP